jgi:hypothetical protein
LCGALLDRDLVYTEAVTLALNSAGILSKFVLVLSLMESSQVFIAGSWTIHG